MVVTAGVHQVVAGAAPRDAISNHVLAARDVIRRMGIRSEIFCDPRHIAHELAADVHPSTHWHRIARDADLAILHYSIDSPAFGEVADNAAGIALHYHNVTPPDLLWRDAPALARQCRDGRARLGDFVGVASHTAADSHFNAAELTPLGYPAPDVIGVFRQPLAGLAGGPDRHDRAHGRLRMLFVGRGAPNKCQHDAILALGALVQDGIDSELRLVGSWGGNRAYLDRCMRIADRAGVADRVVLLGSIPDAELAVEYARADLFLCLSEHEGYCVPLIEAMAADLPIIGYRAGAVPETVGSAGLLLSDKSPGVVAEAITAVAGGALADELARGRAGQSALHSTDAIAARLSAFVTGFRGA